MREMQGMAKVPALHGANTELALGAPNDPSPEGTAETGSPGTNGSNRLVIFMDNPG
jgi:hypothetical protein